MFKTKLMVFCFVFFFKGASHTKAIKSMQVYQTLTISLYKTYSNIGIYLALPQPLCNIFSIIIKPLFVHSPKLQSQQAYNQSTQFRAISHTFERLIHSCLHDSQLSLPIALERIPRRATNNTQKPIISEKKIIYSFSSKQFSMTFKAHLKYFTITSYSNMERNLVLNVPSFSCFSVLIFHTHTRPPTHTSFQKADARMYSHTNHSSASLGQPSLHVCKHHLLVWTMSIRN